MSIRPSRGSERTLPDDVKIDVVKDESVNILDSVNDVQTNIIIGVILTSMILYLFLHNLTDDNHRHGSDAGVSALRIPADERVFGFTLNIMSMLGLGLSIGTLVVNAIVILENVTRRLDAGEPAKVAAVEGTQEVTIAVIGSTMTNIFVFIPIAFMTGDRWGFLHRVWVDRCFCHHLLALDVVHNDADVSGLPA